MFGHNPLPGFETVTRFILAIKKWLRAWLSVPSYIEFEDLHAAQETIKSCVISDSTRISSIQSECFSRIRAMENSIKVGVDVNYHGFSWAIVCTSLKGHDIIKVVEFPDQHATHVIKFMEQYQTYSHKKLDVPRGLFI